MKTLTTNAIVTLTSVLATSAIVWAGPIQTDNKQIERTTEESLSAHVDFGAGTFELHKTSSDFLVDAELTYDRKYVEVFVDYDKRAHGGRLEMSSDLDSGRFKRNLTNDWDVGLASGIPIDIDLEIGAATLRMDLSDLAVTSLKLDVGAAEAEVWWDQPNTETIEQIVIDCGASSLSMEGLGDANFKEMRFDGGVGSFNLDFGGAWTQSATADFDIGLGSLELTIPEHIGVRIETEDSFLSSIDVDREYREVDVDIYESDNYDSADVTLDITIAIGMGSVEVRSVQK
jgi:hypothetical protein